MLKNKLFKDFLEKEDEALNEKRVTKSKFAKIVKKHKSLFDKLGDA